MSYQPNLPRSVKSTYSLIYFALYKKNFIRILRDIGSENINIPLNNLIFQDIKKKTLPRDPDIYIRRNGNKNLKYRRIGPNIVTSFFVAKILTIPLLMDWY